MCILDYDYINQLSGSPIFFVFFYVNKFFFFINVKALLEPKKKKNWKTSAFILLCTKTGLAYRNRVLAGKAGALRTFFEVLLLVPYYSRISEIEKKKEKITKTTNLRRQTIGIPTVYILLADYR